MKLSNLWIIARQWI